MRNTRTTKTKAMTTPRTPTTADDHDDETIMLMITMMTTIMPTNMVKWMAPRAAMTTMRNSMRWLAKKRDGHAHFETLGREQDIDCGVGHGHDDGGHGHGAGDSDPHVWMDPHNVIYWVLMIRDALKRG